MKTQDSQSSWHLYTQLELFPIHKLYNVPLITPIVKSEQENDKTRKN